MWTLACEGTPLKVLPISPHAENNGAGEATIFSSEDDGPDFVSNVAGGSKPATLDTGAVVNVPLFVNTGDEILVDTRTGQYMSRA